MDHYPSVQAASGEDPDDAPDVDTDSPADDGAGGDAGDLTDTQDAKAGIGEGDLPPDGADAESEMADEVLDETDGRIYLVTSIDTKKRTIGLTLPDSPRRIQYGYTRATRILDDHGQFMSAAKLLPGRAVQLGDLDDDAKLSLVQLSPRAWYQENITRYSIDTSIGMIVIGDTKYRYDQYLRVFSGDQEIAVSQIGENDVLSVQGLDKRILSIRVTTGHGTIALENTGLFEGGWISLGTRIYAKVTPNMTMEVPEGTYELSVANDGYGDTKSIVVERSKVTRVDLDEYKGEGPKSCRLKFDVNVDDALLYIDGEQVDYDKPVELRYGVYRLTVIADGYETWERQLAVHSEEAEIEIGEPELSGGDEEDESGGDGGSSGKSGGTGAAASSSAAGNSAAGGTSAGSANNSAGSGSGSDASGGAAESAGYGSYLDTLVNLVESLAGLGND